MLPRFKSLLTLSLLASVSLQAGCASIQSNVQTDETLRVAERLRSVSESPAAPKDFSQVQVKPSAYIGAEVTRNERGDPLPAEWQTKPVTLMSGASTWSFQDIASRITQQTQIPVALDTGASGLGYAPEAQRSEGPFDAILTAYTRDDRGNCHGDDGKFVDKDLCGGSGGPGLDSAISALQNNAQYASSTAPSGGGYSQPQARAQSSDIGVPGTMRMNYKGKLHNALEMVAANFNLGWSYEGGQIVFSKTVTRAFDVPALPIIQKLAFDLSSQGTTGGDSVRPVGGGQTASTEGGFDIWKDLEKTMGAIVGSAGTFQMSPQTAQIVVVAPPVVVRRVETYLRDVNAALNKQVAVSVKVFSVQVNDANDQASDLRVLLREAGRYGLSLYTPQNLALDALSSGDGWALVGSDTVGGTENELLRLLSERGDTSVVTSASVTSLNGVPVPVQVARTRGYLAKISNTATDSGGAVAASLEPGSVTTGFNLHLVPRVMRDGDLLMQYGMNISELVGSQGGFNTFSSGGQTIQLPDITQRNFIQQARIPSGKTLVLAGFEQVTATDRRRGPLSPVLWPLGGSRQSSMGREIIVIAITPVVMDIGAPSRVAAQSPYMR